MECIFPRWMHHRRLARSKNLLDQRIIRVIEREARLGRQRRVRIKLARDKTLPGMQELGPGLYKTEEGTRVFERLGECVQHLLLHRTDIRGSLQQAREIMYGLEPLVGFRKPIVLTSKLSPRIRGLPVGRLQFMRNPGQFAHHSRDQPDPSKQADPAGSVREWTGRIVNKSRDADI